MNAKTATCLLLVMLAGCAGPSLAQRREAASFSIQALQNGAFDEAAQEADLVKKQDPDNPYALLVGAISRYQKVMHQLFLDGRSAVMGVLAGGFNHRYMRFALEQAESELTLVEADLAKVAAEPRISLDLCLACWERDWNHNGEIDRFDRNLFQIERDANGEEIPEGDPRRTPTFRFDHGDVYWGRAFVSFQRAALNLVLAYKWTEIDRIARGRDPGRIVIRLDDPERVHSARQLLLDGLDHADRAREAYLAETDDEREWLPNPRQREHPLPLPVDDALYETWEGVTHDLRQLVQGETGLNVAEVAQLGDHQWQDPPRGYIDIGRMLREPKDIVLDTRELDRLEDDRDVEGMLHSIFGDDYVPQMRGSQLTGRLARMKGEMERGEETFERKLRYLIWLN